VSVNQDLAETFRQPSASLSLPQRDSAYVVGDHGMVYRYRVVPIEYTAKGALDAPVMPKK
jgi:hypothetical protein